MRLVVDANIFVCLHGFHSWAKVFAFLENCGLTLVTIESVYRTELGDSVRPVADTMIGAGHLALVSDPDDQRQQPKKVRKLRKRIKRNARRCPPTSQIDQQLLLVAMRDDLPLATDEGPLQRLADSCNVEGIYDLLDAIEAIAVAGAITGTEKDQWLGGNPGGRQMSAHDLNAELSERGGSERFDCGE